ncbi:hypothetical protein [Streptomyces mirabilis]|uniref:hypothetical protein n=1 Tax=Streptomyces mirabilis TaxID=68239 RepID=UPI003681B77B
MRGLPLDMRAEAVSASVSAGERDGAGTVPGGGVVACEGVRRVVSVLVSEEEWATAEAERLVPSVERLVLRVVVGASDRSAMEERRYVVGIVAAQLRAGARHSVADGSLVLRWQGETTVVGLAA